MYLLQGIYAGIIHWKVSVNMVNGDLTTEAKYTHSWPHCVKTHLRDRGTAVLSLSNSGGSCTPSLANS